MLAVLNDKLMKALSAVIDDTAIISNPFFATDELRFQNEAALLARIEKWSAHLTAHEADELLLRLVCPRPKCWMQNRPMRWWAILRRKASR